MPAPGRIAAHLIILFYLTITAHAFFFTMTKIVPPYISYDLLRPSYGMMAPYQGDRAWNGDLRLMGELPDGTMEPVDIDRYLPYGEGERNVRKFLRVYGWMGPLGHRQKFGELGLLVLDRERARGKPYRSIEMYFDYWWRSPEGYSALRLPDLMESTYITRVQ